MSLLGGITDFLFGKPEAPEANFEEILKLLQQADKYSNPNLRGLFSGWEMSQDPSGRLTQTQTINPAMQPGFDRFVSRFNEGSQDPQLEALKNARFESIMSNQGQRQMPQRRERADYDVDDEGNRIPRRQPRGLLGLIEYGLSKRR